MIYLNIWSIPQYFLYPFWLFDDLSEVNQIGWVFWSFNVGHYEEDLVWVLFGFFGAEARVNNKDFAVRLGHFLNPSVSANAIEPLMREILHDMLHAFGFSEGIIASYSYQGKLKLESPHNGVYLGTSSFDSVSILASEWILSIQSAQFALPNVPFLMCLFFPAKTTHRNINSFPFHLFLMVAVKMSCHVCVIDF